MIGPQTAFSQHLHSVKYRTDGESFDDYCVRYARTLADDEHHFRHLLGALREQRILPGGRQQLAIGRPFQTTAFSCFRGDTEILTEKGFRCFADMEGEEVGVLSPVSGVFERATIRHYGDQTLNRIILSSTFRDQGETFEVYATENHRWVLQGGSVVDDLMVGDLLQAGTSSVEIDDRGWVHGFVCGDGSACDTPDTYQAFLYGPKGNHLARIKESGVEVVSVTRPPSMYERQPERGGVPLVRLRSRINLKELPPPDATPAYLRGFVHGLLAADGCHKTAPPVFNNTKRHLVEWMRDHMILAGYAPVGGLKVETKPSNIDRASGREERISPLYRVLFRPVSGEGGHYGCRVLAIDRAVSHETVYCADEPKHHQLTLRRGLRTGNCYVGGVIPDSMAGIMDELKDSALTLRAGGGCGWNFSTLRPELDPIRGLGPGARASGPVGFMPLWHTMCATIMSAGMRRGAMMGVLDVTHPDILKFIRAKRTPGALTNFNVSVNCTDAFMEAVEHDGLYELKFDGQAYQRVRALDVWATIMESNWDWAEPGVLFLDRTNRMNPLSFCEKIYATNPCGEQPLPPHGACLLGSLNVVKYLVPSYARGLHPFGDNGSQRCNGHSRYVRGYELNLDLFREDARAMVRAFDNVIENTVYPLPRQQQEARDKRRMGCGVTGMANALEVCGFPYGTSEYLEAQDRVLALLRDTAYETSVQLAIEKGSFPLFDAEKWLASGFAQTLPEPIREKVRKYGLRNGVLLSIAPTGTLSLTADNVSSGIEPPYALEQERLVNLEGGQTSVTLRDYALENYGVRGRTASECSPADHVRVLCAAQKYVDSSISKTINCAGARGGEPQPGEITFAEFKEVYWQAWQGGAKGCTTYNMNGKRAGIMQEKKQVRKTDAPALEVVKVVEEWGTAHEAEIAAEIGRKRADGFLANPPATGTGDTVVDNGSACFIDPTTGTRTCDS